MTPRRVLWLVIAGSAALRLVLAACLGVVTNEAYYYSYARHLDWGYFDHPPMVGLTAAIGLKLAGWASPLFGLRFGFIVMFAGSSWLMARIARRYFGEWAGVLAVFALNGTLYHGLMISTLAEPDGPLLFFWLLTLDRLSLAFDAPEKTGRWLLAGVAWGLAMQSKYHAILLPAGACLYMVVRPEARACLKTKGPYLAALAGLIVFAPVIAWNATHEWASFLYQGNRAGGFRGLQFEMFREAMIAQVLFLSPWIWGGLAMVLVRLIRRGPRQWSAGEAFLTCQALPAIVLFMGVATFRRIMPHWPLIGFVALMPMLAKAWADRFATSPKFQKRWITGLTLAPVILAVLFTLQANLGLFQDAQGRLLGLIPARVDPTVDTIRWDQVARELKSRGLIDRPNSYVFLDNWRFSSELDLATAGEADVLCFHRDARSYTFWSRPEQWVGRDAIFVRMADGMNDAAHYAPWFTAIEPIGSFPITRAGTELQTVQLFRCTKQTDPFPFGYNGPGLLPKPPYPAQGRRDEIGVLGRRESAFRFR